MYANREGRAPSRLNKGLLFPPAARRSVSWDTCIHVERLAPLFYSRGMAIRASQNTGSGQGIDPGVQLQCSSALGIALN